MQAPGEKSCEQMIVKPQSVNRQRGVTLIEVLVGFVIFTSSLVAVLDYVSSQIYHYRNSSVNLEGVQAVYNEAVMDLADREIDASSNGSDDYFLTVAASVMDAAGPENQEQRLMRFRYMISREEGPIAWTVLKFRRHE